MTTTTININDIIEIPAFRDFYANQSNEELVQSYKQNGQLVHLYVNKRNELINGYRMKDAIKQAGGKTVIAIIMYGEPDIFTRIQLNRTREKSIIDKIQEMKEIFKKFPKKMGQKNSDGTKYDRFESIESCLGGRWKGHNVISKLEFINQNDLEGDTLLKGIVGQNWKVDTCEEFIKTKKDLDLKHNYGFSEKLVKGEINVADANKLIEKKHFLDKKFKHSFVIPQKVNSYNIDCTKITGLKEFEKSVDLIFTSPPYFQVRKYDNGQVKQLGAEKTKEEFCKNLTDIFGKIYPTLKKTANVIINIGESYDGCVGLGIPQLLKHYIETYTPLIYKETMIWSKSNPKPANDTVLRPWNSIEYLLWFVVDPKKAKYQKLTFPVEGKKPQISKGVKDVDHFGKVWDKKVTLTGGYARIYNFLEQQKIINVIRSSAGANKDVYDIFQEGHPAIMNASLPVVPILMTTVEGDLVYDPFAGSNVVGRVSTLLNRRALSTELSEKYFQIGCKMLEEGLESFDRNSLDVINIALTPQENETFTEVEVLESIIPSVSHELEDGSVIYNGNNLDVLKTMPDNSTDSIVTDPPYHLTSITKRLGKKDCSPIQFGTDGAYQRAAKGFMGKKWDGGDFAFRPEIWKECLRVLKPGGHLIAFSHSRTYHKMAMAIDDAGFEIRDQLMWIYGSGFPKSHNVALSIDKQFNYPDGTVEPNGEKIEAYKAKSPEAENWEGWGTALKPAHEPMVLARKPFTESTVAKNVLMHGTGGINIEDCRIPNLEQTNGMERWPANVILDEDAGEILDEQYGIHKSGKMKTTHKRHTDGSPNGIYGKFDPNYPISETYGDTGGVSRYFYCAKANSTDKGVGNNHPTVKPTSLMEHLVKMVTPKDGKCLDIFLGSGSTGKACIRNGFQFIGIEKEKEYFDIAVMRCEDEIKVINQQKQAA